MSLFQKSVEQKYLKRLDSKLIDTKYNEFKSYFGNPEIQENIRNSKEEQFQEGFFRELFVKILGYTLNPSPNFNLTTEYKNIKDSKKADGAIIISEAVKGVIELKGTNTTDLGKIEAQAFGYKNNQPDCVYVITSNFEKLRFYIDNAIEFIEFNLFKLTKTDFEILFICLAYDQIAKGIPKKVKDESISQEDVITKKLYSDYSLFKRELHQNLVSKNPQFDALNLFRKSQKLLDRFLFLFFAEDRQLLPPNSVRLVLNDWKDLQDRDVEIPLYDRFKKYFEYLNTGFKGKRYDVFAYNGGLFKPDEILDKVTIDDEILFKHTLKLSEYDFASEVDVNILGHIFENSLNELDDITREHAPMSKEKAPVLSRRKKDGVFYTPKYITKYIVENTIGKLCAEKKAELQFNEEDYNIREHTPLHRKKTKQAIYEKLKTYQNWLLQLTICDPACGSGAFLNQALDFLITEHRYIDELQAKLLGVPMILSDVEKSILENNLFGVDLNEESVEIAKLSLWLRTAQPNRKLNDLSNNIKCGNSLISDPAVAGEKAFDWEREFPQVFHKKNKRAWHITCATHNSRYSQRMFDNFVKLGEAVWLSEKEEEIVSQTIAGIVETDKLNIPAYNICGDHIHLILVCEEAELSSIVQKIKSMTARACNIAMGRTIPAARTPDHISQEHRTREHAPLFSPATQAISGAPAIPEDNLTTRGTAQAHLWTQKFGNKEITSEEQLLNTVEYIRNNRKKHELPEHTRLHDQNIAKIICSIEHAFRTEYTGGFDVVIGNPPYVRVQQLEYKITDYLKEKYEVASKRVDISLCFIELSRKLVKKSTGLTCFITSNQFLTTEYGQAMRKFLLNDYHLIECVDFGDLPIFADALTYVSIFTFKNCEIKKFNYYHVDSIQETNSISFGFPQIIENDSLSDANWNLKNFVVSKIWDKIFIDSKEISDLGNAWYGIITGADPIFIFTNEQYQNSEIEKELFIPLLRAQNCSKYYCFESEKYVLYPYRYENEKTSLITEEELYTKFPKAYDYLLSHKIELENRKDSRDTFKGRPDWYCLTRFGQINVFNKEKIVTPGEVKDHKFCIDLSKSGYSGARVFAITIENELFDTKYVLCLLNSALMKSFLQSFSSLKNGGFYSYSSNILNKTPIKQISHDKQQSFVEKADLMLSLNKELQEASQKFQRTIQRKFDLEDLPGKLQNWYLLSYKEFIAELGKKKVKLSLSDEAEWEDYFLQEAKKTMEIKAAIESTDKEIDQMVYQLYRLTDEEIMIVEGA